MSLLFSPLFLLLCCFSRFLHHHSGRFPTSWPGSFHNRSPLVFSLSPSIPKFFKVLERVLIPKYPTCPFTLKQFFSDVQALTYKVPPHFFVSIIITGFPYPPNSASCRGTPYLLSAAITERLDYTHQLVVNPLLSVSLLKC